MKKVMDIIRYIKEFATVSVNIKSGDWKKPPANCKRMGRVDIPFYGGFLIVKAKMKELPVSFGLYWEV